MPVFQSKGFFYSKEIGYFDSERLSEFIDDIEYHKTKRTFNTINYIIYRLFIL